jgi:hypothetical protein
MMVLYEKSAVRYLGGVFHLKVFSFEVFFIRSVFSSKFIHLNEKCDFERVHQIESIE